RHLGHGGDAVVCVPRVAEIIPDPTEQLVVIRRGADLAAQVAKVLDQEMPSAVLADLEVVAARVDTAEDPGKPRDQQIVLRDMSPDLLAAQGAGGEPLEVLGTPERVLREQLGDQRVEPFFGGHGASDYSVAPAGAGATLGGRRR